MADLASRASPRSDFGVSLLSAGELRPKAIYRPDRQATENPINFRSFTFVLNEIYVMVASGF